MPNIIPPEHSHSALFLACLGVSAYLSGSLNTADAPEKQTLLLNGKAQDADSIAYLYDSLKNAFPDAGQAYWVTRSWDLLCWQPLAIAFIAVYQCQQAPSFIGFTQQVSAQMVSGFSFSGNELLVGEEKKLIQQVGKQLKPLFESYQFHLNERLRCRPGFAKRLLADNLMAQLVALQKHKPKMDNALIIEHAQCWFEVLALDKRLIASLYEHENSIELKRSSCCLAYKVPAGKLCDNCPKQLQKSKEI